MNFDQLPLHDAPFYSIAYTWQEHSLRIELSAFINNQQRAIPYILQFNGVKGFELSHEEPWGPSDFINEVECNNGEYKIKMQSGDILLIKADSYDFNPVPQ